MRYFFALWTGFIVYSLISLALGPGSLQVQRHLSSEIERISKNLNLLETANKNYQNTAACLESDRETLSIYMRQLGYGSPDENFIRIIGLESSISPEMSTGWILTAAEGDCVSDKKIKIIALVFSLVMLLFFLTVDLLTLTGARRF